jgi:hypothetical protein
MPTNFFSMISHVSLGRETNILFPFLLSIVMNSPIYILCISNIYSK